MGAGYAEFKTAYASRPKVLYVGANDGMLHCFDAATGEELWGFIPYNLLPKLRNMYAVDAANNTRYYAHDVYCDGSPAVADVQIGGVWKTVLVTGQGPGQRQHPRQREHRRRRELLLGPRRHRPDESPAALGDHAHVQVRQQDLSEHGRDLVDPGHRQGQPFRDDPLGGLHGLRLRQRHVRGATISAGGSTSSGWTRARSSPPRAAVSQVNTASLSGARTAYRYANIVATIPGSPTAVDLDGNGFTDSVFVGDLDGRLYRLNVTGLESRRAGPRRPSTPTISITRSSPSRPSGSIRWKAVRPGPGSISARAATTPRRPTGTIRSSASSTTAATRRPSNGTWASRPGSTCPMPFSGATLGTGSKVWADPVIADQVVYFSTLRGSIEAVNPCVNLGEARPPLRPLSCATRRPSPSAGPPSRRPRPPPPSTST